MIIFVVQTNTNNMKRYYYLCKDNATFQSAKECQEHIAYVLGKDDVSSRQFKGSYWDYCKIYDYEKPTRYFKFCWDNQNRPSGRQVE